MSQRIKVERSEPPLANFYVERQLWVKHGACVGMDPDLFFLAKNFRHARQVCKECPVRRDCAEQALIEEGSAPHGRYGYRGCLTPDQRSALYATGGLSGRDPARIPVT